MLHIETGSKLPTKYGEFNLVMYETPECSIPVLIMGEPKNDCLVRIHSACFTGEALYSQRCDCRDQLDAAMARIADEGEGVIIYLFQEGRGIGLLNKIKAYHLQDKGLDTVEANEHLGFQPDLRTYGDCIDIIQSLNVSSIRLLTNNPDKVEQIEQLGISVTRTPIITETNEYNKNYLEIKEKKMNHLFHNS